MKEILLISKDLYKLLNKKEKYDLYKIQALVAFMTLGEMIGIASVIPFMVIVSNPSSIQIQLKIMLLELL